MAPMVLAKSALTQDVLQGADDPYLPDQDVVLDDHDEPQQVASQPLSKTSAPRTRCASWGMHQASPDAIRPRTDLSDDFY